MADMLVGLRPLLLGPSIDAFGYADGTLGSWEYSEGALICGGNENLRLPNPTRLRYEDLQLFFGSLHFEELNRRGSGSPNKEGAAENLSIWKKGNYNLCPAYPAIA